MSFPLNLFLIRHGESEGNLANKFSRVGDNRYFTPEHSVRSAVWWRLTDAGIRQAHITGEWLKDNGWGDFSLFLCSPYLRAVETAAYLGLKNADWLLHFDLRERDYGIMDCVADDQRKLRFPEYCQGIKNDPFYTKTPQGESYFDLCCRLKKQLVHFISDRTTCEKNMVIVSHGDTIRALRVLLEDIDPFDFNYLITKKDPYLDISNCQVVQYTRINPKDPDDISSCYNWVRSFCPSFPKAPANYDWQLIRRFGRTNKELLEIVEKFPRIIK